MKFIHREYIILLAVALIISAFCIWGVCESYTHAQIEVKEQLQNLFEECLHKDKDARENQTPFFYSIGPAQENKAPDDVVIEYGDTMIVRKKTAEMQNFSSEDKKYFISQLFLMRTNPIKVAVLDSFFCNTLHQNKIPAKTAVVYEEMGVKHCSSSDSAFYASAWKLKEVVFGFDREIVLSGYVKIPITYIIAHSLPVYVLVFLVFITGISWIIFWRKRKRISYLSVPKVPREGVLLREDLLYDEANGVFVYKDQEIVLTGYKQELFNLLLKNNGQFIPTDTLKDSVWPDGLASKDALMQTVKRLRTDLKDIPFLQIENLRGNGYRLLIRTD
ncbi:winged helix-turn-helix domain-containing protein [Parabacteroides bouchesdurhonensis]|uniref:winged helix-turn-helix domain-containing protein n=1 Tax=Parabacteroides bouchesdurhonensis TaxID=1936995 RepID=UPI000E50C992|nr:helix-turn-helix domain-containing protein [Parabacteroides bouchesdurhonensis]RHJ93010.1 helix-turn-helix domain-containing protein [Bacteroides sp. AM07-16]